MFIVTYTPIFLGQKLLFDTVFIAKFPHLAAPTHLMLAKFPSDPLLNRVVLNLNTLLDISKVIAHAETAHNGGNLLQHRHWNWRESLTAGNYFNMNKKPFRREDGTRCLLVLRYRRPNLSTLIIRPASQKKIESQKESDL
jgi:hypothetical protein